MRGVECAAAFDATDGGEQLRSRHFGDRSFAEPWKDVPLKKSQHASAVIRSPLRGELTEPFAGDHFKAICGPIACGRLGRFAVRAWIDAGDQELARFVSKIARAFQADIRIDAKRKTLLLVAVTVLEAPPFSAGGRDFEVQSPLVEHPKRLLARLGFFERGVSQGHSGNSLAHMGCCPQSCPQLPPVAPGCQRIALYFPGREGYDFLEFAGDFERCWTLQDVRLVASSGIEPELSALRGRRVNQLHHDATMG
jgi:hypothetical protein